MEIFARFIIEDETGTYVNYDEVKLKVDITDLVQQRKEEAVQLLKGKDIDALSIEDTRAMNNLISKYENLIEEREREELAKRCLGLSWKTFHSEETLLTTNEQIVRLFSSMSEQEQKKALYVAKTFLQEVRNSKNDRIRERAGYILSFLEDIKSELSEVINEEATEEKQITFPDLFFDLKDWQITLKALRELSLINDRGKWIGGKKVGALVGAINFWKEYPRRFSFDFSEYELATELAKELGATIGKSTVSDNIKAPSKAAQEVRSMLSQMLK